MSHEVSSTWFRMNLLTSLPFFFLLFLSLQKESEEPFRLCSGPLGPLCCWFSPLPPEYNVCMCVCARMRAYELWLMQPVCLS